MMFLRRALRRDQVHKGLAQSVPVQLGFERGSLTTALK
jgi:hypothetical protein